MKAPFPWALLVLPLASAWLGPACTCGRLEIGPSNRIVEGRFESLWGHPWAERQKYVMTERIDPDGGPNTLTVVRLGEKLACDLPIQKPVWYVAMGESLLAFDSIDWDRWTGRIVEVALPCGPVRPLFENAYLALWRNTEETTFYALVGVSADGFGKLVRVVWPAGTTTEIRAGQTTDFFDFDWPDSRFFHRENGQIVATRLDGREERRVGEGVTGFGSSGHGELLLHQGRRLVLAWLDGSPPIVLSDNACATAFTEEWITFLEPCYDAPSQIVLVDRESLVELGRVGNNVDRYRVGPEKWLSWLEGQEGRDGPGTLWVREPLREPHLVAEGAQPSWQVLDDLRVVLHAGRTEGDTAELFAHSLQSGESVVLAKDIDVGIPISESPWSAHWAVVEGTRPMPLPDGGALRERMGALVGVHPVTRERIPVAEGVPVRGFRFSWQAPALGYLWRFDAASRTGAFEVFSMIDRKKISVDEGVSEFEEVWAPKRGVSYIVRIPGREGLYFVEADVHLF
jgi:hypothetical protein